MSEQETLDESARHEIVEGYIRDLAKYLPDDPERTLVVGNLRGFFAYLCEQGYVRTSGGTYGERSAGWDAIDWKSAYAQALERAEAAEQDLLTAGASLADTERERNVLLRGQGADQAIVTEWSEMKAVLRTLLSAWPLSLDKQNIVAVHLEPPDAVLQALRDLRRFVVADTTSTPDPTSPKPNDAASGKP